MPSVLTEKPQTLPLRRKLWTRQECVALEQSGVWAQQHLELLDGEVISKMGKNRPHTVALAIIHDWLQEAFGKEYVNAEAPIDVAPDDNPTNEPEPDIIVFARPFREFMKSNPRPQDLRLAVEISDSSLGFDLNRKAELYARAGIIEYWVADIQGRRFIVHRDPQGGQYKSIIEYKEHESVYPLTLPASGFLVSEAFPE